MRIVVVSPRLPTRAMPMRGVSRDEQLQLFAGAGHEVRGVVPLPWSPRRWLTRARIPDEERDGAVTVTHPRYPRLPRFPGGLMTIAERGLFARAAAAALGREWGAPDVVLAQSATLPGGLLGRIRAAAFVVAIHDHELYEWARQSRVSRVAIARTLRRADCAVYVSAALQREGISLAGPHRSTVIPIGIEIYQDLVAAPPSLFTVCTVARLVRRKRIDHLIRAFARLLAAGTDARLVIVGDGPERAALSKLVRMLGIDSKVEMTGALDARKARELIARSSVMALPSVLESLGAVYLEAMSLGVPTVGTRGEGIEDYIEHGVSGILVPPNDEDALLVELRALADSPERARRIGEGGRRRFMGGEFSWRANTEAYLALFHELTSGRSAGRT